MKLFLTTLFGVASISGVIAVFGVKNLMGIPFVLGGTLISVTASLSMVVVLITMLVDKPKKYLPKK